MHRWATARGCGTVLIAIIALVMAASCTSGAATRRPVRPMPAPPAGSDMGAGRPGLAVAGGRLYVGWAASTTTTRTQPFDLGWTVDGGSTIDRIIEPGRVPAGEGPAVTADGTGVDVAWADGSAADALTAAYLDNGTIRCRTAFGDITTPHSPALVTTATGIRYLAWIDTAGHLSVGELDTRTCASTHAMTLTHRTSVAGVRSTTGPAIIDDGTGAGLGVVLAWTDSTGMVNVGTYRGTGTLAYQVRVRTPVRVSGSVGLGFTASDLYLGFVGTDGVAYHAYSEGCTPACFHVTATATHAIAGYGIASDAGTVWAAYLDSGHYLRIERF